MRAFGIIRARNQSPFLFLRWSQFHDSLCAVLIGARAILVIGRCSVRLHALLRPHDPSLLGAMLSQRPLERMSPQRKLFLGVERLQLLCCSASLSVLLLRLATSVGSSGSVAVQPKILARVMKRFLGGIAHRLWAISDISDD